MAKGRKYRFYEKPHTKNGIFSAVLAGISVVLLLTDLIISFAYRGKGGIIIGGIGLIAFMLSLYGFIMGMRSFREKSVSNLYSIVGSIGCGVMGVVWLTLFLTGIS